MALTGAQYANLIASYVVHNFGHRGVTVYREVYLGKPIEMLEQGLEEGLGSRHRDMPQIQFSSEQAGAILDYLGSLVGRPPSTRPPASIPSTPDAVEPP